MIQLADHHRPLIASRKLADLHRPGAGDGFAEATANAQTLLDDRVEPIGRRLADSGLGNGR